MPTRVYRLSAARDHIRRGALSVFCDPQHPRLAAVVSIVLSRLRAAPAIFDRASPDRVQAYLARMGADAARTELGTATPRYREPSIYEEFSRQVLWGNAARQSRRWRHGRSA